MKKWQQVVAALGVVCFALALASIVSGVTPYNMTIRIVDSAGNVVNGVASATTALYNQTVRVVDSSGNVIDSFGGGAGGSHVTAPIGGDGSVATPLTCTTCATTTNGGALSGTAPITVSASGAIGANNVNQTVNTQAGDPLYTLNGMTWGVENVAWTMLLPGGTLGPFDVVKCHYYGDLQNNTGGAQSWRTNFYFGTKIVTSSMTSIPTSATARPWTMDATIMGDGATNLNSMDSITDFFATAAGLTGGAASSPVFLTAGYSEAGIDTTQNQTIKVGITVNAATPAATPTLSPTAATTPITHLYEGHCWRLTGTTPTPTATPTPTQTPTATPT